MENTTKSYLRIIQCSFAISGPSGNQTGDPHFTSRDDTILIEIAPTTVCLVDSQVVYLLSNANLLETNLKAKWPETVLHIEYPNIISPGPIAQECQILTIGDPRYTPPDPVVSGLIRYLSYESKPTAKRELYDWMAERNLDE